MNYHLQSINQLMKESQQLLYQKPETLQSLHHDLEHLRANVLIENNIYQLNQQLNHLLSELQHKTTPQKPHINVTSPIEEEFEEINDDERSKTIEESYNSLHGETPRDVIGQLNGYLQSTDLSSNHKQKFQDILNDTSDLMFHLPQGETTNKYLKDYLSSLETCIGSFDLH